MANAVYDDYDTEPIGGGNPYYRCVHCKRVTPAINGRLEGHAHDCAYRLAKEALIQQSTEGHPVADALALADAPVKSQAWATAAARMSAHCLGEEDASDAALRILAAAIRQQNK